MMEKLNELKQDSKNFNKHSHEGMSLMKKSMKKFGFVEAGLISEDNVICAGNGRQETALALGMKEVQIIDIDGKKPIFLRKKGLKSGSKEFKEMALALNAVAQKNIVLDVELVKVELGNVVTTGWGVADWTPAGAGTNNSTPSEGSNYLPGEDDDEDESGPATKSYTEPKYPLSIVLNKAQMIKFDGVKAKYKVMEDTTAFLKMMDIITSE